MRFHPKGYSQFILQHRFTCGFQSLSPQHPDLPPKTLSVTSPTQTLWHHLPHSFVGKTKQQGWRGKCAILTSGSEEKWVIITFIFNGRKRNNLYKVICFKLQIYKGLGFHSLQKDKSATYFKINDYNQEYLSRQGHGFANISRNKYIKNPLSIPAWHINMRNLNTDVAAGSDRCGRGLHSHPNDSFQLQESLSRRGLDPSLEQQLSLVYTIILSGSNQHPSEQHIVCIFKYRYI